MVIRFLCPNPVYLLGKGTWRRKGGGADATKSAVSAHQGNEYLDNKAINIHLHINIIITI